MNIMKKQGLSGWSDSPLATFYSQIPEAFCKSSMRNDFLRVKILMAFYCYGNKFCGMRYRQLHNHNNTTPCDA